MFRLARGRYLPGPAGGSWFTDAEFLPAYDKQGGTPTDTEMWIGFRFARNVPGATEPYFIAYNGNGSTGGTVPTDPDEHTAGDSVTLSGAGTMVRTGHTFQKWTTASNCTGTDFLANASISMPAGNLALCAQWMVNSYTITWYGNVNTGGSVPVPVSMSTAVENCTFLADKNCTLRPWG